MLIGDKYKIESDDLNVTLFQKKIITGTSRNKARATKRKVGEEYWWPIAYFNTPNAALYYLADKEIKDTGFKDFNTVVEKIEELHGLINSLTIHED